MKKSDVYKILKNKIDVAYWWLNKADFEESKKWFTQALQYVERFNILENKMTKKYFVELEDLKIKLEKAGY